MRKTIGMRVDGLIDGFVKGIAQKELARLRLDAHESSVIGRFEALSELILVNLLRPFGNQLRLVR
jgi:hypothetical protein